MRTGIIIMGGEPPPAGVVEVLPAERFVVAVDSGLDHAAGLGMRVDLVVGDLDSVTPAGLAAAERAGVPVERHPPEKDATDAELAVDAALRHGCDRLVGVTSVHGRVDHLLAVVGAFAAPHLAAVTVTLWVDQTRIDVLRPGQVRTVRGDGRVFSVLPIHGAAHGVAIAGARYPLDGVELPAGTSRGVSNVTGAGGSARVSITAGVALLIVPDALEEPT